MFLKILTVVFATSRVGGMDFSGSVDNCGPRRMSIFLSRVTTSCLGFRGVLGSCGTRGTGLRGRVSSTRLSGDDVRDMLLDTRGLTSRVITRTRKGDGRVVGGTRTSITVLATRRGRCTATFRLGTLREGTTLSTRLRTVVGGTGLRTSDVATTTRSDMRHRRMLFSGLGLRITTFGSTIASGCGRRLDILRRVPSTIRVSPREVSRIVATGVGRTPSTRDFVTPAIRTRPVGRSGNFTIVARRRMRWFGTCCWVKMSF